MEGSYLKVDTPEKFHKTRERIFYRSSNDS